MLDTDTNRMVPQSPCKTFLDPVAENEPFFSQVYQGRYTLIPRMLLLILNEQSDTTECFPYQQYPQPDTQTSPINFFFFFFTMLYYFHK